MGPRRNGLPLPGRTATPTLLSTHCGKELPRPRRPRKSSAPHFCDDFCRGQARRTQQFVDNLLKERFVAECDARQRFTYRRSSPMTSASASCTSEMWDKLPRRFISPDLSKTQ